MSKENSAPYFIQNEYHDNKSKKEIIDHFKRSDKGLWKFSDEVIWEYIQARLSNSFKDEHFHVPKESKGFLVSGNNEGLWVEENENNELKEKSNA